MSSGACLTREEKSIKFLELLNLVDDYANQKLHLSNWQKEFVSQLQKSDENGIRLVKRALLYIPRKNGKTYLIACLVLLYLVADKDNQEIYSIATSREQASKIFDYCCKMIRASKKLSSLCNITESKKLITIPKKHNLYKAMSGDSRTPHGLSPSICLVDEYHLFTTKKHFDLYEALTTGTGARKESLIIHLSTAGSLADNKSLLKPELEYARRVAKGEIQDPHYLAKIFEADITDDPFDEAVWYKANPGLVDGYINIETLRNEARLAKEQPSKLTSFKRYYLNITTDSFDKWLPLERWDQCKTDYNEDDLAGKECFGSLDLSTTRDITAFTLTFYDGSNYKILPYFWVPRDTDVDFDYRRYSEYLTFTDGEVVDYETVANKIVELSKKYYIKKVLADPYQANATAQRLIREGIEVEWMKQSTFSLNASCKELERSILSGKFQHNGNELLRLMASNVCLIVDQWEKVMPSKKNSTGRIDGIVCLVMSIAAWIREEDNVYNDRGMISI
jgi:phage terminase large subunit-like protein